jgi:hypothetical protein
MSSQIVGHYSKIADFLVPAKLELLIYTKPSQHLRVVGFNLKLKYTISCKSKLILDSSSKQLSKLK